MVEEFLRSSQDQGKAVAAKPPAWGDATQKVNRQRHEHVRLFPMNSEGMRALIETVQEEFRPGCFPQRPRPAGRGHG